MAYKAYITTLKNVRPHPNATKMKLADCFGNTVCVGLDAAEGELGVYFPVDGQLSVEFCQVHDLVRRKDENGQPAGGYLDPDKRNIKAIKLRGEKSDGLFMPISCLAYTGINLDELNVGDTIDIVNAHEICCKYIPRSNHRTSGSSGNKTRKKKVNVSTPYFVEHIDTPQLRFTMNEFKPGDIICLTEKIHGTSSRNANALTISYKRNIIDKIFRKEGKRIEEYKYVVGTRRTILENAAGGYYGSNEFRFEWANQFKNKLMPGECVFGEIAGFITPEQPIMAKGDNKKTKDKNFIKTFGDTTVFSYGCDEEMGNSRYFIYRMTYTTPEGFVFEYPWDLVKLRAEQMGFEIVPELERFIYTTEEEFIDKINRWLDIPSTLDSKHIIEGVVVRALNSPYFKVAKEKSFNFKVIEGIIKEAAINPDLEEAEEIISVEI